MLLSRDYIGYMAREVVKRLVASQMIETKAVDAVRQQVRLAMADELS